MAKKKRRKNKARKQWRATLIYEISGLLLLAITLIGISEMGVVGETVAQTAKFFAGTWNKVFLVGPLVLAVYYIWQRQQPNFFSRRLIGTYLLFFALLLLSHVGLFETLTGENKWTNASVIKNTWELYKSQLLGTTPTAPLGGGMIGAFGFAFFYLLFDATGTTFMAVFLFLIAFILITGKSLRDVFARVYDKLRGIGSKVLNSQKSNWEAFKQRQAERKQQKQDEEAAETESQAPAVSQEVQTDQDEIQEPIIHDFSEHTSLNQDSQADDDKVAKQAQDIHPAANGHNKTQESGADPATSPEPSFDFPEVENESYQLPSFDLLQSPMKNSQSNERGHIAENVRKLEKTFDSFGVKAKVKKVHLGPAVTKYEVYPDVGVKVSRIVNLNDDLALALAAKEIRIEAPIPGKSAVGIEVPNQEIAMVSLREVLESTNGQDMDNHLAIALGRDISGEPVLSELNKMPHLLVAGATGSGKSVCINGIITSILMRTKPHEVKLLMVDPKMVELNVYNGVPHLLTPVVTDPKKASQALKKVVSEMERRYELFSETGTRNLESYNQYVRKYNEENEDQQPLMPYIVVIIDELSDLMMVASKEVEDTITRLAQMARAAGIHLIIATQRPSVDVITGVIKANIPSRIAFSVSSQTDSRTILDSGGAEKLLGKGDMLFTPIGASKPTRVQGAFLSDEEVEAVVNYVVSQQKAQYQENMIPDEEPESGSPEEVDDELFDDAVQMVMEMQTASVSMLQRRFRIGYTRAARLIDAMEDRNIVGPYEGSKPRQVLASNTTEDVSSQ
ncbi:DNA translocase FtsK [Tuberibacillus sp. Marseille-P3662]|uniref:DNA translocase FtsK n=1 Tax=Tuberibacillus sp. Marseille-P3662 TaxID=1965358 RepID=UPI000A1CD6F7|nr:DNA translocase FtsK [Tuberibacillus sp. Marseille-P3662]